MKTGFVGLDNHQRLGVLDGYRALAILLVLGFHYCSRWTPPRASENLYPYGDLLRVINSKDWQDFALRRTARLVPSMFLCSIVTYAILTLLPIKYFEPTLIDFVPSLSFIEPALWEKALGTPIRAIDGAYWSLFVEVKFYFWACLLFFVFKVPPVFSRLRDFLQCCFGAGSVRSTDFESLHSQRQRCFLCFILSSLVWRWHCILLSPPRSQEHARRPVGHRNTRGGSGARWMRHPRFLSIPPSMHYFSFLYFVASGYAHSSGNLLRWLVRQVTAFICSTNTWASPSSHSSAASLVRTRITGPRLSSR